jgi:shikimate dehydrogenase
MAIIKLGLLGKSLSHSFSKTFFEEKFRTENITGFYDLIEVDNLNGIKSFLIAEKYDAIHITIPYKIDIIKHLNEIDENAKKVGAVNFVTINNNIFKGYNTDIDGFEKTILKYIEVAKTQSALVFGDGGASKAVCFVLVKLNIEFTIVSRKSNTLHYKNLNNEIIKQHTFLINTTSVGMFPNVNDCIEIPYDAINEHHIAIDLIYNPEKSLFLQKCEQQQATIENGLIMLVEQAESSFVLIKN